MQEEEFYAIVQEQGQLATTERAQVATDAVLETLGETLTGGEAENVAEQLPTAFEGTVGRADHDAAGYDREAFVERVNERLVGTDLDPSDAEAHVEAVTDALTEALTEGELERMKSQLDDDLSRTFEGVDVDRDAV